MASSRDAPFSGTTITYQAAPGEANFVTVNWGNVAAGPDFIPTLDDHVDITAREPCEYDTALGARCPMLRRSRRFKVRVTVTPAKAGGKAKSRVVRLRR
jgi:hypothetical protein